MNDEERETRRKLRQLGATDTPAVSKEVLQVKQFVDYILRWIDLCGPDGDALACTNIYYKDTIKAERKLQHDQAQLLVDSTCCRCWDPARVGIRIEFSGEPSFRNSV